MSGSRQSAACGSEGLRPHSRHGCLIIVRRCLRFRYRRGAAIASALLSTGVAELLSLDSSPKDV
jgi:hypothetical protein